MKKGPTNPERSFGISVGAVLCVIGAVLAWRGRVVPAEVTGATGATLLLLGLFRSSALRYPSAIWWRFARGLGHVNARVLLTVFFLAILAPIGVLWRLTGNDPLHRRKERWPGWSPYPARYRDRRHYRRMY